MATLGLFLMVMALLLATIIVYMCTQWGGIVLIGVIAIIIVSIIVNADNGHHHRH